MLELFFICHYWIIEKDDGHDRYVLEPTDVKKHMSSNIYGDVGDMADPEFRLSVRWYRTPSKTFEWKYEYLTVVVCSTRAIQMNE